MLRAPERVPWRHRDTDKGRAFEGDTREAYEKDAPLHYAPWPKHTSRSGHSSQTQMVERPGYGRARQEPSKKPTTADGVPWGRPAMTRYPCVRYLPCSVCHSATDFPSFREGAKKRVSHHTTLPDNAHQQKSYIDGCISPPPTMVTAIAHARMCATACPAGDEVVLPWGRMTSGARSPLGIAPALRIG